MGTLVLGIGNSLRRDDGIGPRIAKKLGGVDCGETPENFVGKFLSLAPEKIFIIDAVDAGKQPGEVLILNLKSVPKTSFSSHKPALQTILKLFPKTDVIVVGVQGKDFEFGDSLSAEVLEKEKKILGKIRRIIAGRP